MSELRRDPVLDRWVIIAPARGARPYEFATAREQGGEGAGATPCPFCPGNEAMTMPEVLAYRGAGGPNEPGWSLRVVPNKFAALEASGAPDPREEGFYRRREGAGVHEVIIETPEHERHMVHMTDAQVADVLRAYRDRIAALGRDPSLRYVVIFKNHGRWAGASLRHSHSQLVALPFIPPLPGAELEAARRYREEHGRCGFCDLARRESEAGARVVAETEDFLVFVPYAARFPYEVWIVPKAHEAVFEDLPDARRDRLALTLRDVLGRLGRALDEPDYLYYLHTAPLRERAADYHWHLEIMPALTQVAGFERGSGLYINDVSPEDAARRLREA